jgi:DNA-directed RNA polymerase subunit RPC12/RpoP
MEELKMKMTYKCIKCGYKAEYVKEEDTERLGMYAFDCYACSEQFMVPQNNPSIKVEEE